MKILKKILIFTLRYSGFPLFVKYFIRRNKVTIVYYHDIDEVSFQRQIDFISKRYSFITVDDLCAYLYKETEKLPHNPILITFDDGHIGNYKLLEVIKRYNFKPTIFLTTDYINSNKPFWFKLPFKRHSEKEKLKKCTEESRISYLKEVYSKEINEYVEQALSWNQVSEMKDYFNFHSHTHQHPCLPNCGKEYIEEELKVSKTIIEDQTQKSVYAIAYPNGDYSEQVISSAKDIGYKLGFTGKHGFASKKNNPLEIPRLSMNDTKNFNEFVLRLSGAWYLIKKIKI